MRKYLILHVASYALCGLRVFAQSGIAIVGVGHTQPTITVAPGLLTTIFVSAFRSTVIQRAHATSLPLPATLAGISVSLEQSRFYDGAPPPSATIVPIPVPLLAVSPFSSCEDLPSPPCSASIGITVQIPFELVPVRPDDLGPPAFAQLVVSQNGVRIGAASIRSDFDRIHILRFGDTVVASAAPAGAPIVLHADGTLVSASKPARGGEILVMYAVGLSAPLSADVRPVSGSPPSSPMAVSTPNIGFDFRPNALPVRPPPGSGEESRVLFAGLIPSNVGIYQINFQIPDVPVGTPRCGGAISSNLTVTIAEQSFDGAGICLEPEQQE